MEALQKADVIVSTNFSPKEIHPEELSSIRKARFIQLVFAGADAVPDDGRVYSLMDLASSGYTQSCTFEFEYNGKKLRTSSGKSWKTTREGMERLSVAGRLNDSGRTLRYILFADDFDKDKDNRFHVNNWPEIQTHIAMIENVR